MEDLPSDSGEVDANQYIDRYRIEGGMFCEQLPSTAQHTTALTAPPAPMYKSPPPPLIRATTIPLHTNAPPFIFNKHFGDDLLG